VARFTFDLGGRPLTEDWDGDGVPEISHAYDVCEDDANDLLCRGPGRVRRSPPRPAAFDARALAYDARGRMLTDGLRRYEWNGADQLARVTGPDGATSESRYGHEGVRRSRARPNVGRR
jgi:YD repeat-containing protein